MKNKLLLLTLAVAIAATTNAQRLFFLFGHGEYASATGNLRNMNERGLGVEAGLGVGMNKTFFTGTVGSTWLRGNQDNPAGTLRYVPVKFGVRRYVLRKNVFVKSDLGIANMRYNRTGNSSSNFTATAGAGVKLTGFEVLGDFTTVSGYGSWVSIKAGFTLGI